MYIQYKQRSPAGIEGLAGLGILAPESQLAEWIYKLIDYVASSPACCGAAQRGQCQLQADVRVRKFFVYSCLLGRLAST